MKLGYLVEILPAVLNQVAGDVEIRRIAVDSRHVQPGDLFVAIPGVNVDGHCFVAEALAKGAVAVVGERSLQELPCDRCGRQLPWGTFAYVRVPDAREAWGWLCAAWHDFPSRKMALVGVTGTDGKTTTVNLVHAILRAAGLNAGMVSTVNARIPSTSSGHHGEEESDTGLHTTTPDPPDVQRYLARMVEVGATHAVLEVTSHGLAQHRVAGCEFDVAAVTNITHEHLDFHGALEAYRQAKAQLFEGLTRSFRKPGTPKVAVLNRDDDSFRYLSLIPADRQIVYGVGGEADVTAHDVRFAPDATCFTLHLPGGKVRVETPLVGAFNVSNVLAAVSVAMALDVEPVAIREGVAALRAVPGRMERIRGGRSPVGHRPIGADATMGVNAPAGQDFLAIVDFAHTPNALRRALQAARAMVGGRVIVVFGSAGLRDREKRTLMGHVAGELADLVIVTAEDPRTESLDEIMAQSAIAAAAEGKREGVDLFRVPDRGEAILLACREARAGDVVIACGKGHEQSMCFGTTEYPWDDREAMRRALHGETLDTLPTAGQRLENGD
jgi:UDP-N-acetylmuramoyl-L-alanyl-D-glutamate--2,6-diaminopimelate ligase